MIESYLFFHSFPLLISVIFFTKQVNIIVKLSFFISECYLVESSCEN